jgi:mono/diheme cytochrome c family protein
MDYQKNKILKKFVFLMFVTSILALSNCNNDDNVYKQGKVIYTRMCANCHQEQGEGVRGLIPPLAKSDYLAAHRSELSCLIRHGQKGTILVNGVSYGTQEMVGIPDFTEFEMANILNYVSTSWGNTEKLWTVDEVREALKNCN